MPDREEPLLLFSYGTLQLASVQLATFGRRLEGIADALPGHALEPVRITDPHVIAVSGKDVHMIARRTGKPSDCIAGTVFAITPEELAAADRYEVGDYRRVRVRLESGNEAFLYVAASGRSKEGKPR